MAPQVGGRRTRLSVLIHGSVRANAVRKYVPELPDFGVPLTIRHSVRHTSGSHAHIPSGARRRIPTVQGTFTLNMPFENVCGNGGLLTTVGDLLK